MLQIKKWGHCIILIAIAVELILWPSLENLIGCGMTLICWIIFSKIGLNETTIKEHIFSWLVFLSMSLYRILPLLATLLECHSIGYNFVNPIETYLGETCLFLISALAFYLATNQKKALISLKIRLYKCGFYDRVSDNTIWCLGILGLIIRFYLMSTHIQIGDIIGKALSGFTFFQYAPIMLFFPSLYKMSKLKKIIVFNKGGVIYFIFIILLSFATNSRYAILEPFGTFALLFLLSYIQHPSRLRQNINKKYIILGIFIIIFLIPFVSDVSLAMLANRGIRGKVSTSELFSNTINTYLDRDKMNLLRKIKDEKNLTTLKEQPKEWSENYVSNFALNRYCNMRVSDNTLYHAKKVGFANEKMYSDFWNEIIALLPSPILNSLGIQYNKNERYSRGDKLKALSTNSPPFASYLVTSHLADGLLTFGFLYFPIEFFLFYLRFLFLDTFIIKHNKRVIYSILGLTTIFSFLAMFRNAGGACDSLPYLLREYWQDIILFLIGFSILKKLFDNKMMKILFIYRHPSMGFSIGKVFRPIEEEMKKYAEVDSIYMPTSQYSLNSIWQNIKTTRKAINSKKYDIVHITGTEHYLIPFLLGEKVVVTVHDLGHYFDIHGLKKILFWIMQIFSLKFAKAITCISNFTVQELKKTISIKNNKISVIFNEVDKNFSFKEKEFNKDYPVILHIGTRPHKNLSRTIKALNGIKCKLRIIGEITNKELDLLQKYKTDYSFASNLSDNDLLKEYQNADIINFPSCHEGFGMPIIEGQAVGRIVVTSNIEPMISVANNGAAICDPYNIESIRNTYIRVINDFQYRNDIILKGIDNVKKYSIETVAKQYFELYKTL